MSMGARLVGCAFHETRCNYAVYVDDVPEQAADFRNSW